MSDIYAMGGEVTLGLNIAAWPDNLPTETLSRIFAGGADKMAEVGAVIAGGHTVTDPEPKYGLCVTGTIHPDRDPDQSRGAGRRPRLPDQADRHRDRADRAEARGGRGGASGRDDRLDAEAEPSGVPTASRRSGANACTDVTGFSLVGHAAEMAEKSGVCLRLTIEAIPFLSGAMEYAELGFVPGGVERNRSYFASLGAHGVRLPATVRQSLSDILHDPQTSGGLLISLPANRAAALEAAFAREKAPLWPIGEVLAGSGVEVTE